MLLFHKGLDLGFGEVGFHLIITLGSAAAANLLKSMKEESEKVGLKCNIQKTKIMINKSAL